MDFNSLRSFILKEMNDKLSARLHYHGVHHTISVMKACGTIADSESLADNHKIVLQTAALLHDVGFISDLHQHEKAGAAYASKILPQYGYAKADVLHIHEMILATEIPQDPQSHLAEILCDADLAYLGSDYFYTIGNLLYLEFKERQIVKDEQDWNRLQIQFLSKHTYFTDYAKEHWSLKKKMHLNEIKQSVLN